MGKGGGGWEWGWEGIMTAIVPEALLCPPGRRDGAGIILDGSGGTNNPLSRLAGGMEPGWVLHSVMYTTVVCILPSWMGPGGAASFRAMSAPLGSYPRRDLLPFLAGTESTWFTLV